MNNEQIIKDTAEYNFNLGFQKGKLEQKKEELELLVKINGLWFDDEEKGMINIIQKRIKQLQKEIGEEKQDEK